jgi:cold shock CspA family protein
VVQINRQPAQLADLQPGQRVRVLVETDNGRRAALAIAARGPLPFQAKSSPAPLDPNAVSGTLQRVALSDREIVVVGRGSNGQESETTFAVPDNAAISRDGKPIKLDDLKEGEHVSVRSEQRDGKMSAAAIQAGGSAVAQDAGKNSRIERIRRFLQTADYFLKQLSEQENGNSKP